VPRAGLNTERVVDEAIAVLDDVGADGLTLTGVADRVGVAVPSLYKHVGGLVDLRRRVTVRAVGELGAALATAADGRSGSDGWHALAHAYRSWALAVPGRYAATVRAPAPDDTDHLAASGAVLAVLVEVMAGYDIEGEEAIHAIRAVRAALHGFVALEAAGGFGLPEDVDTSFDHLVDALDEALRSWGTRDG
jgi:AcrR family transcriptional regulator